MVSQSLVATPGVDRRFSSLNLYGGLFAAAVAAFCLTQWIGPGHGPGSDVIAIVGSATCGWSWLLVRALFQTPEQQHERWPLLVVLSLVVIGASLRLAGEPSGAVPRMMDNVAGLISSTMLLLAALEPVRGLGRTASKTERRFRIVFAAAYTALLAIAVIWVNGAPPATFAADWNGAIKAVCALFALAGMAMAIGYRRRHPLPEQGRGRRRAGVADDSGLGDCLVRLMKDDALYARPDLRMADLARLSGEAEYKVTQCITGTLGFRNFNQMTNHFRIGEARRRLADPALSHLPVLTIAFDCGFASIGPFNRAFKNQTRMTPVAFRRLHSAPDQPLAPRHQIGASGRG